MSARPDFTNMKQEIINWLSRIEKIDGQPPKEVIAFNFGIYETEMGFKLYLVGGFEYDEHDDDWACIEVPSEEHRQLELPNTNSNQDWEYIQNQLVNVLVELESEGVFKQTILRNALAITTGFDDGDLTKIR